jgi:hypothetical protein
MEIELGKGIGPIRFGMTPAEVRAAFPEREAYEDWMGGNLNDALPYPGMIVGFDGCDARGPLADARVCELIVQGRRDLTLDGVPLHAWTRDRLRARFALLDVPVEDDALGNLFVARRGVSFGFDAGGRVEGLQMWAT